MIRLLLHLLPMVFFFVCSFNVLAQMPNSTTWQYFDATQQLTLDALLKNPQRWLALPDSCSLVLQKQHSDNLGFTHYRYQQFYADIPIEGFEYLLHEKEGKIVMGNGTLWQETLTINRQPSVCMKPKPYSMPYNI